MREIGRLRARSMVDLSRAGPEEGINRPDDEIVEFHEEFNTERLFIGWSGNGYQEDTCWILANVENVCDLSSWE